MRRCSSRRRGSSSGDNPGALPMVELSTESPPKPASDLSPPASAPMGVGARVVPILELNEDTYMMLKELADRSQAPIEEIVGKAFLLYKIASDAVRDGKEVGIAKATDALESRFTQL